MAAVIFQFMMCLNMLLLNYQLLSQQYCLILVIRIKFGNREVQRTKWWVFIATWNIKLFSERDDKFLFNEIFSRYFESVYYLLNKVICLGN